MQEKSGKRGWYDGWFYGTFLDLLTGKPFDKVFKKIIPEGSTVIDVGCGTGATARGLAEVCSKVAGVDISPKMIRYAEKNNDAGNIEYFLVEEGRDLGSYINEQYDYVILKMVLHEAAPSVRDSNLNDARTIAKHAIIADFLSPQPGGLAGIKTSIIEYLAGKDHYSNFKDWCSIGGIDGFLKKHSLIPVKEKYFYDNTGKIVIVELK